MTDHDSKPAPSNTPTRVERKRARAEAHRGRVHAYHVARQASLLNRSKNEPPSKAEAEKQPLHIKINTAAPKGLPSSSSSNAPPLPSKHPKPTTEPAQGIVDSETPNRPPFNDSSPPPEKQTFLLARLPRELRQDILSTYIFDHASLAHLSSTHLTQAAQNLSLVHPLLPSDMPFVLKQWESQRAGAIEDFRKESEGVRELVEDNVATLKSYQSALVANPGILGGKRRGAVVCVGERKKKRVQKCWKCGERHWGVTRTCPYKIRRYAPWFEVKL